jgi:MFS family permease
MRQRGRLTPTLPAPLSSLITSVSSASPSRLVELGYPIDSSGALVGYLVAAYAAGLIISSPPIAWAGEKVKGRRMPLVVALLFMAGGTHLYSGVYELGLMRGNSVGVVYAHGELCAVGRLEVLARH